MAKGGGGEGHFDERRRAAAAKPKPTYKADSPEVLSAIQKPRAKPTVVVKKKKVAMPMAKPTRLAQVVNRGAKQDKYFGDIVNRDVKTSFGGPLYSNVAGKGNLEGEMVNRQAKANFVGTNPNYNVVSRSGKGSRLDGGDEYASLGDPSENDLGYWANPRRRF